MYARVQRQRVPVLSFRLCIREGIGMSQPIDEATKKAVREVIEFLAQIDPYVRQRIETMKREKD